MIETPLALVTIIATATALAFWLDYRVPALGKVGASMLALIFGAILSNTGLVPARAGVYDAVFGPVTSVAIAWLLLSVNLRDLRKAGPRMVGAFGVAVAGTVLGAFVAAAVYGAHFGEDTMRMAGALAGAYAGGSVTCGSVGRELGLAGALFAGLNAADAVVTGLWLAACLVLPLWIGQFYAPVRGGEDETESSPAETESAASAIESERHARHPYFAREGLSALSIANLIAMREEKVIDNVARHASLFKERLHGLAGANDTVMDVRGTGYLYALALGHSREEGREYSDEDTKRAVYEILPRLALEAGLHLRVDDRGGAKIMLSPPLVATTSELDEITERVSNVLVQLAACL